MAQSKSKQATYTDIEALPPHVTGEILFGTLHTQPRPARRHAFAAQNLGATVTTPFGFGIGGPGGWVFAVEPELHLGPHVIVPDIAGWRRENIIGDASGAYFEEPPDWLCEIHSPSTRSVDLGPKRRVYATFGVSHLWYVDPPAQTLEVFQLQDRDWLLLNTFVGNEDVRARPFDAISFPLGLLWPFDKPIEPEEL